MRGGTNLQKPKGVATERPATAHKFNLFLSILELESDRRCPSGGPFLRFQFKPELALTIIEMQIAFNVGCSCRDEVFDAFHMQ